MDYFTLLADCTCLFVATYLEKGYTHISDDFQQNKTLWVSKLDTKLPVVKKGFKLI